MNKRLSFDERNKRQIDLEKYLMKSLDPLGKKLWGKNTDQVLALWDAVQKLKTNIFKTISVWFFGGMEIKILFDEFRSFSKLLSNLLSWK